MNIMDRVQSIMYNHIYATFNIHLPVKTAKSRYAYELYQILMNIMDRVQGIM